MGVPLLDAVSLIALQTILNTQVANLTLRERREVKKPGKNSSNFMKYFTS